MHSEFAFSMERFQLIIGSGEKSDYIRAKLAAPWPRLGSS